MMRSHWERLKKHYEKGYNLTSGGKLEQEQAQRLRQLPRMSSIQYRIFQE
jgi:hypothetical protein